MKTTVKILGIVSFALAMTFSLATCDLTIAPGTGDNTPTVNNPPEIPTSRSVNRFQAESYTQNDRIKYSFSYNGHDFYYIYLGKLANIPLYFDPAYYHSGMVDQKYTFTKTKTETTVLSRAITRTSQEAVNIIDENTQTATTGVKLSSEIKAKFPIEIVEAELKVKAENSWSDVVSGKTSHSITKTTSLTDTVSNATTETYATMEAREFNFTRDVLPGFYRWTNFGDSDVYLYVIKDSTTNDISWEFREYVIPGKYYWALDYSETNSFGKYDLTNFKLDLSVLENLPKPAINITDDDIPGFTVTFNANGAAAGSPPASQKVTSGENFIVPNQGTLTYTGRAFGGWNTQANGSGENYTPGSNIAITGNITLYAVWVLVTKEYTIGTMYSSGGLGTTFTGYKTVDDVSAVYRADFDIQKLRSLGYTKGTFTYTYSMGIWGTIEYKLRLYNVTTGTLLGAETPIHTPDNGAGFNNRTVSFEAPLAGLETIHKVEIQASYRKTQFLWGGDFEIKSDRKLRVTFS